MKNFSTILKMDAFLVMNLSSIEIYKREALGYLIGYKTENLFIVEHAIPFQTAKRGFVWAEIPERRFERIKEISQRFNVNFDIIGYFHSHAMLGDSFGLPEPSGEDIAFMEKGLIYIIIAINECGKKDCTKWHNTAEGLLKGSLRGYMLDIAGFYLERENKFKRSPVFAPFATGF